MKLSIDLFFNQAKVLIRRSRGHVLQIPDLLPLPQEVDPKVVTLNEQLLLWDTARLFLFTLMKASKKSLVVALLLYLVSSGFALVSPMLVHNFIQVLGQSPLLGESFWMALGLAVALGLSGIIRGVLLQHYFFISLKLNQKVVSLLNRKIFFQSLKLSPESRQKIPVGDIVNYMSSDTEAVADMLMMVCEVANTVLLICGVVALLFYYTGWSAVPPLLLLFGLAPLTKKIARSFVKLDEEMMAQRDLRVTLMSQILNAIRTVKFFSWESSVHAEIHAVREKELQARRRMARAEVFSNMAYVSVSAFVLLASLITQYLRHQPLTADIIFTCVSLFTLLAEPFGELSRLISRISAGTVGAERIIQFLKQKVLAEFIESKVVNLDPKIQFQNVQFQYPGPGKNLFQKLSFDLNKSESLAIVGPVGAGKTTLMQLLLQELVPTEGTMIQDFERRAYVPQEAFIINGSLRENLCFGHPEITEEQIQKALFVSCLDQDMKLWPSGLDTEIGEKGVNLSGGQKQRVGLARAWLSHADLMLLDDPLSAVDIETEQSLCDRLIFGEWKSKARVVVTHRLQNLFQFDKIVFLQADQPAFFGTWVQLNSHPRFKEFFLNHEKTHHDLNLQSEVQTPAASLEKSTHRITDDEEREQGAVKRSIYGDYVLSLGGLSKVRNYILMGLFVGALIVALMPLLQRAWLAKMLGTPQELAIYGGLALLTVVAELMNNLFWLDRGIKAGQLMHDQMLESILKAKIRFFDSTPVGRILQRFSRDVESVDIYLQWSFDIAIHCLLFVGVSLALILSLVPWSFVFLVPILYLYYRVQKDYRGAAREAKRMDSVARSPRYAHFKETLMGLSVIRAYRMQTWFQQQFFEKLTFSHQMFYNHYLLNRWFSSRIPLIGGLISAGTGVLMVFMAQKGQMTPGVAGLVTVYTLSFWGFLHWGIRIFSDLESRMTSVERLKSYSRLPQEVIDPLENDSNLVSSWPQYGEIQFENVYARYAENLPFVLQGVTFQVPAGARVGLVGRTGSGKSTLFQTLFRLVDIETGDIKIDEVSIKNVPLSRLRKSLAIIPQDPTLFMGSLRSNLDRYAEATDEDIWRALNQAGLEGTVRQWPGGLDFLLHENGSNCSQGQRQLICLSRALLRNAKIIVLDEATASVDVETDVLLQQVLRRGLAGVTLLIIAHRLGTVADCDLVVELSQGRVLQVLTAEDLEKQKNRLRDVLI